MKTLFMKAQSLLVILSVLVFTACRKDQKGVEGEARSLDASSSTVSACGMNFGPVDLPEVISGNRTLDKDTIYLLDGKTWVINGTLTIEPGTVIRGVKKSTPAEASALIITRTAQVSAPGTASCPIIFTSNEASPAPGDWGGVVVLGDAQIATATGTAQIEGINLPSVPAGADATYGGTTVNDNSGVLQYIRIEYAGAVIVEGNELNGLTLGGVGCGTTMDHIQVLRGADDGFEFFGGDVNAKYLFAYSNNDDEFDFDFGYNGNLQFLVAIKNPSVAYASNNSNGIECDGGLVSQGASRPVISNMTLVGFNSATGNTLLSAMRFRVDTRAVVANSAALGFNDGIELISSGTINSHDTTLCGTDTTKTYFFNNVVHAYNTQFKTFTPHSSNTSIAAGSATSVGLTNEFPALALQYFSTNALTPNAAPASSGTRYCSLVPTNCGFTFDSIPVKGGAVAPGGTNWIVAGYNSGTGWIKIQ